MEAGESQNGAAGTPEKPFMDINQIAAVIPHRYPFLLVDKVLEVIDGQKIVAIKNVTANEPFFTGHFPGRPVMPGVMILEALAQAAAILAKVSREGAGKEKVIFLTGADKFRWKRVVMPGDTLRLEVNFLKARRPMWVMEAKASVDGKVVTSGQLSAMEVD